MAEADLRLLLRTIADNSGAEKTSAALRRVQQDAAQTNTQMLRGVVASAAGFVSLTSAASALGAVLRSSIDAQRESERVGRATAAAYGGQAAQFTRFAASLSAQTGFASDAILEAALSARTLSTNYGLSIQQTQQLIRVSADLARVRGIGVAEAFERVQSAIRGEAEASEYLGLTLNDTFIKNNALGGSVRTTFERMTDVQKAQIRYNELLRQTAAFSGQAAKATNTLEGAFGQADVAANKLQLSIGKLAAPTTITVLRGLAAALGAVEQALAPESALGTIIRGGGPAIQSLPARVVGARRDAATAARDAAIQDELELQRTKLQELAELERQARREIPSASGAFATERASIARAEERQLQTLRQIALQDQVEAAVRDITSAQEHELELRRESVNLAAQEAQIRLNMLPAQSRMAELQRQMTEQ